MSNPMVPFLAGWLAGVISRDAGGCMRVVEVVPVQPDHLFVKFASGLVLKVALEITNDPEAK